MRPVSRRSACCPSRVVSNNTINQQFASLQCAAFAAADRAGCYRKISRRVMRSSSEGEDDVAINAAHTVQGNRLSAATPSQYSRHLDSFKSWIESSWCSDAAERQHDLALILSASREFVLPMRVDAVERACPVGIIRRVCGRGGDHFEVVMANFFALLASLCRHASALLLEVNGPAIHKANLDQEPGGHVDVGVPFFVCRRGCSSSSGWLREPSTSKYLRSSNSSRASRKSASIRRH